MAKIFYDKDADLKILKKRTIAILGYGSQGHAHAQNLRDSGLKVIVADVKDSENWRKAKKAGFEVYTAAEAAAKADVISFTLPDELHRKVYEADVKPNLKKGDVLVFAHGFNIRFFQIVPPKFVDVILVAPKGPGHVVRSMYQQGLGVPNLIGVEQDTSKQALKIALAYSKGLGGTRAGALLTSFAEETETDLFGEQVILCGGVSYLIKAAFHTLVEAGYQPEVAYFECLHELKLITDLIDEGGISWMRYSCSDTAEYGDYTRGPRIITEQTKAEMKKILKEIQDGSFAKEWLLENQAGRPMFNSIRKKEQEDLIEKVGEKVRKMMPWIKRRQTEIGKK